MSQRFTFINRRIRSGFLWLPKTIRKETRWLIFATWEEGYLEEEDLWVPYRWIDFLHQGSPIIKPMKPKKPEPETNWIFIN